MTRPDPVVHHRERVHTAMIKLDPDPAGTRQRATATANDGATLQVAAVLTTAVYADGSGSGIATVDLTVPPHLLDDHGRLSLNVGEAVALAGAVVDAADTGRRRAEQ